MVSNPSVFVFLIPAFALIMPFRSEAWRRKLSDLCVLGIGAVLALLPWLSIFASEFVKGGLTQNILAHFTNPYEKAGFSGC